MALSKIVDMKNARDEEWLKYLKIFFGKNAKLPPDMNRAEAAERARYRHDAPIVLRYPGCPPYYHFS